MPKRRPLRSFLTVGALLVVAWSCREKTSSPPGGPAPDAGSFDKTQLLAAFGQCAEGNTRELHARTGELAAAVGRLETEGDAARPAAQDAWKRAMDVWERAEVFQFGPTAPTGAPGSQDLRDPIYGWPLVGRCLIDQTLVAKLYESSDFAKTSLVSTRTLATLEYLLFYDGDANGCPAENAINAQGTWAALGSAERAKRRAAYAKAVVADVTARTSTLADAWDPAKGNFGRELTNPGKVYPTQQAAFNAVSDAMFYLDDQVKNTKVGIPAGLVAGCAAAPCVDMVESPWAKRSKDHIRANIVGYEQLLHGCGAGGAGLGFDDLLTAVGGAAVVTKLDAATRDVKVALDELKEPSLEDDLRKNPAGVKKLFDALRASSTLMKSDFATLLAFDLPKRLEGDND